ncbi:hypothetical protein GJR96_02575 [Haloferax sp. MBLA0076]|uniref:Uncharacterized protein n=1 Tax=Haloferax litoreum TaxID=2666140 RepID=A0A6A8GDC7_9EURY|nr:MULTISPECIES: hypothetical protein [Haloferax]KAB1192384.1 hypothetical protein Hfx1148_02560 [Haloferax sp. CBA1148]MRX20849.1 hypothetical protein [Haloferax litoreum]
MSSPDPPSTRQQALVTALQWGLVQAFVLDTVARLLRNYYRATMDSFVTPDWVFSIQVAAPLGLLVGGIGGYRWVTGGRATISAAAHRRRALFVGSLLVCWALAIVPTVAFQWMLGDRFFTVPFFVIPTIAAVLAVGGASLIAYRVETEWYRRYRTKLLGTAKGAVVGLVLGVVAFVVYGGYLAATQTSYSLSGGPEIVGGVCLGAIAGYAFTDTDGSGDRSAEFLVIFLPSVLALTLVVGLGSVALAVLGVSVPGFPSFVTILVPIVAALAVSSYLTYSVETTVYRRFVGR